MKVKNQFERYEAAMKEMKERKFFNPSEITIKHRIGYALIVALRRHNILAGLGQETRWVSEFPVTTSVVEMAIRWVGQLNQSYQKRKQSPVEITTEQAAIETLKNSEKYIYKITRTLKQTWEEVL
jgi:hypothetical protein